VVVKEELENLTESLRLMWSFEMVAFQISSKKKVCPRVSIFNLLLKQLALQYFFYISSILYFFYTLSILQVFSLSCRAFKRNAVFISRTPKNPAYENQRPYCWLEIKRLLLLLVSVQCMRYCSLPRYNISLILTVLHESTFIKPFTLSLKQVKEECLGWSV